MVITFKHELQDIIQCFASQLIRVDNQNKMEPHLPFFPPEDTKKESRAKRHTLVHLWLCDFNDCPVDALEGGI